MMGPTISHIFIQVVLPDVFPRFLFHGLAYPELIFYVMSEGLVLHYFSVFLH